MQKHKRHQHARHHSLVLALLASSGFLLASCGTPKPPAPPSVNEADKRPVNDAKALEIQMLRNQLRNSELLRQLQEQQAQLQAASVPVVMRTDPHASAKASNLDANEVYVITFGHGESNIEVSASEALKLVELGKAAAYVEIRGRTDGKADAPAEARVARDRAAAMKGFLVGSGVDASKVRVTYQPAGDHLSDNASPVGRALNRRVEVEFYKARPKLEVLGQRSSA